MCVISPYTPELLPLSEKPYSDGVGGRTTCCGEEMCIIVEGTPAVFLRERSPIDGTIPSLLALKSNCEERGRRLARSTFQGTKKDQVVIYDAISREVANALKGSRVDGVAPPEEQLPAAGSAGEGLSGSRLGRGVKVTVVSFLSPAQSAPRSKSRGSMS